MDGVKTIELHGGPMHGHHMHKVPLDVYAIVITVESADDDYEPIVIRYTSVRDSTDFEYAGILNP